MTAKCILFKLMKVSARCKISPSVIWKKAKPLFSRAFATGSETATMMLEYDVSRDSMGINPSFSAFWIPLSQSMLSLKDVVHLSIPPILISKYNGMPLTLSFMVVMVILTLELCIASPGVQSAWVILFASLALPPESEKEVFSEDLKYQMLRAITMLESLDSPTVYRPLRRKLCKMLDIEYPVSDVDRETDKDLDEHLEEIVAPWPDIKKEPGMLKAIRTAT